MKLPASSIPNFVSSKRQQAFAATCKTIALPCKNKQSNFSMVYSHKLAIACSTVSHCK